MRKYRFIYWTKKNDVLKEEQRHFYNYDEILKESQRVLTVG